MPNKFLAKALSRERSREAIGKPSAKVAVVSHDAFPERKVNVTLHNFLIPEFALTSISYLEMEMPKRILVIDSI